MPTLLLIALPLQTLLLLWLWEPILVLTHPQSLTIPPPHTLLTLLHHGVPLQHLHGIAQVVTRPVQLLSGRWRHQWLRPRLTLNTRVLTWEMHSSMLKSRLLVTMTEEQPSFRPLLSHISRHPSPLTETSTTTMPTRDQRETRDTKNKSLPLSRTTTGSATSKNGCLRDIRLKIRRSGDLLIQLTIVLSPTILKTS